MKHLLPKTALEHHIAVLGKTGSGKTSITKAEVVELALDAGERVCAIDPTGAWWGLRLLADGKTKGYPVVIFGGRHADKPLLANHGELMAEFIGRTSTPCILDTSLMRSGERMKFFTDFADSILRTNESALRLIIDEAHVFMPQAGAQRGGAGAMGDMLHAGNNLISLGRSRGLRCVLISQRAAKLHKDSLTQVETLIAARLIAPQDRKAVREWIADQADVDKGNEIIASLPKLAAGEAWAWAPEADFLKRIPFPLPRTFDSSASLSGKAANKKLPPLDVKELDERFAKLSAEQKAVDPKELQKRIRELEAEKSRAPVKPTVQVGKPNKETEQQLAQEKREHASDVKTLRAALEAAMKLIVQIEASGFFKPGSEAIDQKEVEKALASAVKAGASEIERLLGKRDTEFAALRRQGAKVVEQLKKILESDVTVQVGVKHNEPFTIANVKPAPLPRQVSQAAAVDGGYTKTQQAILDAIAWCETIGNPSPSKATVAFLSDSSPKSSTFDKYVSILKTAGEITGSKNFSLTDSGRSKAAAPEIDLNHGALMEAVQRKLTPGQFSIVRGLAEVYPKGLEKADLATAAGMSATSSTFDKYLSQTRGFALVEKVESEFFAAKILFP